MRKRNVLMPMAISHSELLRMYFYAPRGGVLQITKCSSSARGNFPFFYCALVTMIGDYRGVFSGGRVS
jgi:hypothetical protein